MSNDREWADRIKAWREELKSYFYRPLGAVELSGFVTTEQLDTDEAARGSFKPMPPGTKWGAKWQYAWFKCRFAVPEEGAGERIVLRLEVTDKEAVILANGRMIESHRNCWGFETLTYSGKAGEQFDILAEAYAWHGPTPAALGPVAPQHRRIPEPPETQQQIGQSSFGIWNDEAYQLHMDVEALQQIRDNIDADSLRVARIDRGLKDFTLIVNFDEPPEQMQETFRAARRRLRPLLECRNGPTAPEMFCIGHAHVDVAWLWPLAETERKAARTLANQLAIIQEYPEHKFIHSQPHLFRMVKQRYPDLYEHVRQAVADGNIIADGGMWVEADTNITGGESLIRQFIHGKRFFNEEFGVDSEMLWLPDVFGYSAAMPQIMAGCGVKYFTTAKIFWNYHGGETFPYHNFIWEGIDGTGVVTHLHHDYNSSTGPDTVIRRWNSRVQKDDMSTRLFPFGHGDGGGGPTRNHLEYIRRLTDCEAVPRMIIASPAEFFEDLVARCEHDANRYVGELYFQAHRGVLTSQAKTKKDNRKCELLLREAEMWGAAARAMKGFTWPAEQIDHEWKKVLLNQFHDILPGSSIQRVYEEVQVTYAEVIERATEVAQAAAGSFTDGGPDALAVFNSLSWPRKALVKLPDHFAGALDGEGDSLCVQQIEGGKYVEATVPSCGWTTLMAADGPQTCQAAGADHGVKVTETLLENELLRVELNRQGQITSVFDKETERELLAGDSNVLKLYRDVPGRSEAWDIDSMYEQTPVGLGGGPVEIGVAADGPLVGILHVSRKLNESTMTQHISLRRNSRRVDFATTINWRESQKLLKVCFVPDIHTNEVISEIQFGHIRRPNHLSRQYDADRFEVANQKWSALAEENRGFAVLNDCKYGLNAVGKSINLTLLRSPLAPDATADKGVQEFTYAFYAWNGSLADSMVVREAYDLNCPPMTAPGAAGEVSLLSVDAPNVVIETVKPSEDGCGDIVVRLYECKRSATRCRLTASLPFASAAQTDMLEGEAEEKLDAGGGRITIEFRPFEIKTIRLKNG